MRNGALAALILGVALALGVAAGGHLIGRGVTFWLKTEQ
jgi:hypothetical protein